MYVLHLSHSGVAHCRESDPKPGDSLLRPAEEEPVSLLEPVNDPRDTYKGVLKTLSCPN